MNLPRLASAAEYRTNPDRVARREQLHHLLQEVLCERDAEDWERRFADAGVPCSRIRALDEALSDPQMEHPSLVRKWPHPDLSDLGLVDHPICYNGRRSFRHDPPPDLGEHKADILREIGIHDDRFPTAGETLE